MSYAHSSKGKPHTQSEIGNFEPDFKENYVLARNSFELPGLGGVGDNCMAVRKDENGDEVPNYTLTEISEDVEALKFDHLKCRRVECPNCWTDWARRRVFDMVLKIEAYAIVNDVRPYFAVASVDPKKVEREMWTYPMLKSRLIRRFYRRADSCGVIGGYRLLHPFRIRRVKGFNFCKNQDCSKCRFKDSCVKGMLVEDGWGSGFRDSGYWKGIRQDALDLGSWRDYVSFEPHLHAIVFADNPTKNESEGFFLSFRDDEDGNPIPMSLERVIGYVFYLITHVGVCNQFKTQPTQSFGVLNGFDPKEALGKEEYDKLAGRIAEKIGTKYICKDCGNAWAGKELGECPECGSSDIKKKQILGWDSEDEEFTNISADNDYDWFPVWDLKERLYGKKYEEWREGISEEKLDFLEELQKFVGVNGALARESDFAVCLSSISELRERGFEIVEPEPPPPIEELAGGEV